MTDSPSDGTDAVRFHVIRKGNVVAGIVIAILALALLAGIADPRYPFAIRIVAAVTCLGLLFVIWRAFLPSVTVQGDQVAVRRWFRTNRVAVEAVQTVTVFDTWDGPVQVRRMALVTTDGQTHKTHYQSRQPRHGVLVTGTDRAAGALQEQLFARQA